MKAADRKTFLKILKRNGFVKVRTRKHEKYTNGEQSIFVPNGKKYSRVLHERLLKEIGAK